MSSKLDSGIFVYDENKIRLEKSMPRDPTKTSGVKKRHVLTSIFVFFVRKNPGNPSRCACIEPRCVRVSAKVIFICFYMFFKSFYMVFICFYMFFILFHMSFISFYLVFVWFCIVFYDFILFLYDFRKKWEVFLLFLAVFDNLHYLWLQNMDIPIPKINFASTRNSGSPFLGFDLQFFI